MLKPLLIVFILLAGLFAVIKLRTFRRQLKEQTWKNLPPPDAWRAILEKRFPTAYQLNEALQKQLFSYMQVFLHRVKFEGCGGQEITEEIKVTIAAQACMLLLGRDHRVYPKLKTVLVYPHTYSSGAKGQFGGDNGDGERLGESWDCGVVVLSWNSVVGGARNVQDGHNVTFHEFAHQLDQEDGAADGAPILNQDSVTAYTTWARVLSSDFEQLCKKTERGKKDIIDRYGTTNPAEFFAVATETFFEKPRQLKQKHPELFEKLLDYYKVNPLNWNA